MAGRIAERYNVSLGHAGAVVEGKQTSATGKMQLFDNYFGIEAYDPEVHYEKSPRLKKDLRRGMRVNALHDISKAVGMIADVLEIKRDLGSVEQLKLNPWFVNLGKLGKRIPVELSLAKGIIPEPFAGQFKKEIQTKIGGEVIRQSMRSASHASANDGVTPRLYGYSLMELMQGRSFAAAITVCLTGELPKDAFEEKLVEMLLIASITNGPGTISAQGAKLSASAGNSPNTALIGTLASIGSIHGGNGAEATKFLLNIFEKVDIIDPYKTDLDVQAIAVQAAADFKKRKIAAQEASMAYEKIPCLGHPVFKDDPVNFDPRERVIHQFIKSAGQRNVFLDFYHCLVQALKDNGSMSKVLAVNIDAALACIWLGVCWRHLVEKRMTRQQAMEIPFVAFALGRVAGGAAEYLDHQTYGLEMDMRIPVRECRALASPRNLE